MSKYNFFKEYADYMANGSVYLEVKNDPKRTERQKNNCESMFKAVDRSYWYTLLKELVRINQKIIAREGVTEDEIVTERNFYILMNFVSQQKGELVFIPKSYFSDHDEIYDKNGRAIYTKKNGLWYAKD